MFTAAQHIAGAMVVYWAIRIPHVSHILLGILLMEGDVVYNATGLS